MTSSKIFFYFCLSFIAGIFLSSYLAIPYLLRISLFILGLLLISVFWSSNFKKNLKKKRLVIIGFCFLILGGAVFYHHHQELKIEKNKISPFYGQEVEFVGQVAKEDVRDNHVKLTLNLKGIEGRILVTANKYGPYQYGDKLKIRGKLEEPAVFNDFNYKEYLAKDSIYGVMYWPQIELVEKGSFSPYKVVLTVKEKLRASIYKNLSPPQSSILGAIILGDKRKLSDELKQKLNKSGVRHLTAVSGMHVMIISAALMSLLIGIGLSRRRAFYFAISLVALFIIMTGFQSSAIRAGILGFLFLFGQHLGRKSSSGRGIAFAAVLMLVKEPLLLKLDVGFQLSFLAAIGIVSLGPIVENYLKRIPNLFNLREILAITFSAQIFALPILIYNFGHFSLVAPLTNVLVVPLLPFLMGLGFIFAFLGLLSSFLGWVSSMLVWLLLTYLVKVVNLTSALPFSYKALEVSWIWLIGFYLVLGFATWKLRERKRWEFLNY